MVKKEESDKKIVEVVTNGQYIKDFSFENPEAPAIYTLKGIKPEIKVSVDINVKKLQEETYNVELVINIIAKHDEKTMFVIELTYAGIFTIKNSIDEDGLKKILFIYCPSLLFPFARRVISDVTSDASLPPLMLDTINFASLYESKKDSIKKID
jgi:preprotein translocase subunit SecB